ncbi:hypothetical protein EJ05DRAFT_507222 [Pseudovirgaria hyperparasitica]|uniref:Uncharacterized protein n=1 Tax=Pseudovirgaria hyperparasitica TaxID=470096 RepID=A0A6A6WHL0_9PEZI|nr:uncharacterized protein EJ05DRAFT_507222 [Pseudovirgaria hyperparasitica]KAF2761564.1 hypothetical protein EJ05DRAFT_507222 [Pseudovirgaria hyperparasitica]
MGRDANEDHIVMAHFYRAQIARRKHWRMLSVIFLSLHGTLPSDQMPTRSIWVPRRTKWKDSAHEGEGAGGCSRTTIHRRCIIEQTSMSKTIDEWPTFASPYSMSVAATKPTERSIRPMQVCRALEIVSRGGSLCAARSWLQQATGGDRVHSGSANRTVAR